MKKANKILVLGIMLMLFSSVLAGCFGPKLNSISVDTTNAKIEYELNEELDFSGVKVFAHYSNDTQKLLNHVEVTFSTVSTETAGEKDVTVTYKKKTTTFTITVNEPETEVVLSHISLGMQNAKTDYEIDEELDFSGVKVWANYSDNTQILLASSEVNFSEVSTASTGTKVVTVTYQGKTVNFNIRVHTAPTPEATLDSIELNITNVQTRYEIDEELDFTGLKVYAIFSDESSMLIPNTEIDISSVTTATAGDYTVTVTYEGKEATFEITVYVVVMTGIRVDTTNATTSYEVNENVDFSGVKVYADYNNNTSQLVPFNEVNFSSVSTAKHGTYTITVSYQGKETIFATTVFIAPELVGKQVEAVERPAFVVAYENNIKTKVNKEAEFYNRDYGYTVGNENAFIFKPVVTAYDEILDEPVTLNKFYSEIKVYLFINNAPVLLVGNELATYVSLNSTQMEYNFTTAAEGKMFKISVLPYIDKDNENVSPVDFTFTVQKGYNVYNAQQFSILDNVNQGLSWDTGKPAVPVWTEYKNQHGINLNADISGIILHSDITIMPSDIPDGYKYQQGDDLPVGIPANEIIGTLRDNSSKVVIYNRLVEMGSTFEFNGNYFQVDASAVPQVRYNHWEKDLLAAEEFDGATHSRLFGFAAGTNQGDFILRNLNLLGNAPRGLDKAGVGGITLMSTHSNDFLMDNVIMRKGYTNLIPVGIWGADDILNKATLNHVKMYDSYSNMFYVWGAKLIVTNSEFKGAGGPIFSFVHPNNKNVPDTNYTKASITNTVIENYVDGTEAWFVNFGATDLVAQIKPLITGIDGLAGGILGVPHRLGKNVNGLEMFNFIALVRSDDFAAPEPIKGIVDFTNQTTKLDFGSPEYQTYKTVTGGQAPIIQTSGGGIGFIDEDFYPKEITQGGPALISPSFFTGEQFYLYYGPMAVVLGFDQVA